MTKRSKNVEIIAETGAFLLVYKPAGLAVESRSLTEPDLEHLLAAEGAGRRSLSAVNRLDQVVEGLVLFAKTKRAAAELSRQLQEHRIRKEYLAVVDGVPEAEHAELRGWLRKDGRTNTVSVVPAGTTGAREAVLRYELVRRSGARSLLRIFLQTGRHHQIRVQLAHAGMPVAGDRKYNPAPAGLSFPALCACALGFSDPESGEPLFYEIKPKGELFA